MGRLSQLWAHLYCSRAFKFLHRLDTHLGSATVVRGYQKFSYRPTMKDMPVPMGSWQRHHQKQQERHNRKLMTGIAFAGFTAFCAIQSGSLEIFYRPRMCKVTHLPEGKVERGDEDVEDSQTFQDPRWGAPLKLNQNEEALSTTYRDLSVPTDKTSTSPEVKTPASSSGKALDYPVEETPATQAEETPSTSGEKKLSSVVEKTSYPQDGKEPLEPVISKEKGECFVIEYRLHLMPI
nr:uncharacterized protein LOC128695832 [Cherax quadricarinatus]